MSDTLTPAQLATRWHVTEKALANERSLGNGLPFTKDASGRIAYRRADVLEAERAGQRGLTVERAAAAFRVALRANCPELSERQIKRLTNKFARIMSSPRNCCHAVLVATLLQP